MRKKLLRDLLLTKRRERSEKHLLATTILFVSEYLNRKFSDCVFAWVKQFSYFECIKLVQLKEFQYRRSSSRFQNSTAIPLCPLPLSISNSNSSHCHHTTKMKWKEIKLKVGILKKSPLYYNLIL